MRPQDLLAQGLHPMQQSLAFEELLAHQLSLRQLRSNTQQHAAYPLKVADKQLNHFLGVCRT